MIPILLFLILMVLVYAFLGHLIWYTFVFLGAAVWAIVAIGGIALGGKTPSFTELVSVVFWPVVLAWEVTKAILRIGPQTGQNEADEADEGEDG